ncbi:hypothetical protein RN001_001551 [Aquatica leii]|uniref:Kinesin motor domain-containing protein n=1 Tax=Aquatica leii TaxID=1421715 RepID=A0AAN7PBS2_9COLE|nr:hypothetical protein RN001_001551 [Aquatica leii]
MTHLKVAVRIRPLSMREIGLNLTSVVEVCDNNIVAVTNIKVSEQNAGDSRERMRRFAFDYCFNQDSTQDEVFSIVEKEVENAIQNRYHSCVLAYGQSSSGKTHTMMGNVDDPGLIPKLCKNLFLYLKDYNPEDSCGKLQSTVSYLEIYNEKVHDLLVSSEEVQESSKLNSLRIREHPKKGPYVQGLIRHTIYDPETLLNLLKIGNANRKVSATLTNPNSSRSHSVLTLTFGKGVQLHLIDLAGSERAANKYNICTLKEGANINKSLVALGNVISTLADHSSKIKNSRKRFVPYRDSVLTWLLKETLGGNSKTTMIATVSPSSTCFNETINTLRFGQRAKKIISRPTTIDDPKERTIRELRKEIEKLKHLLTQFQDSETTLQFSVYTKDKVDHSQAEVINVNRFERRPSVIKGICTQEDLHINKKVLIAKERLLPVMDVTSEVSLAKKQLPKMRRTLSVETNIMNSKPSRLFGSQETILNSVKEKPKRNSQPSVLTKKTVEKLPLVKSGVIKKPFNCTPKKIEKAIITEVKGPQKLELPKKSVSKQRSQIVAAVTNRLYGVSKKKEVATETEELRSPSEEVPKELTICTNARLRLQEITQRALHAHRRKTAETQTDLFPVLRVKEVSTDVDDLKIALVEVKDAEVDCSKIETKDVAINCFEQTFQENENNVNTSFVYTRSCATQVTDLIDDQKPRISTQPSTISFTKYLQNIKEPTIEIVNPSNGSPIYTSTVNINVSHNYINRHRLSDITSEDSIEESNQSNNVNLPTPDIISNHNSLEHGNINASPEPPPIVSQHLCEKCASFNTTTETLYSSKHFNVAPINFCVAKCIIIPKCKEKLMLIKRTPVYASQICVSSNTFKEFSKPFYVLLPEVQAKETKTLDLLFPISYKPFLIKSNIKRKMDSIKTTDQLKPPASINNINNITISDSNQMLQAMSKFMEEATNLMRNLSKVTSRLHHEQQFDLEVTVNNVSGLSSLPSSSVHDFATQTSVLEESSLQNSFYQDAWANTEIPFQIPMNEYDNIVRDSCMKLEKCINNIENKEIPEVKFRNQLYEEETPLGYDSLSRQPIRRFSSYSPSAYLKQLTIMRQKIVDSTRDDLIAESKIQ